MKRQQRNDLLSLVQSFFGNYLERVRGASPHTTRAYRDALKLFFLFMAEQAVVSSRFQWLQAETQK